MHGQQLAQRGADDLVLLGLDRGDDVEHLAGAGTLELGQERVTAAEPGRAGTVVPGAEEVVGHGDDGAAVHHDLAASGQTQGVLRTGPVEGHRDGGPPVDDDGIGAGILDVAAADVPGGALVLVDAPEEERPGAVRQEVHPAREGGHVVEVGVPRTDQIPEELLGTLAHGGERDQRVVEVGLLGLELGIGEGSGPGHRDDAPAKSRATTSAQKSPDIPGIVPAFPSLYKPSTWDFPFSSVRTLNL